MFDKNDDMDFLTKNDKHNKEMEGRARVEEMNGIIRRRFNYLELELFGQQWGGKGDWDRRCVEKWKWEDLQKRWVEI